MIDWFAENTAVLSAFVAAAALIVSIHAELRVRKIASLNFPGVSAEWGEKFERHDVIRRDDHHSPPCPVPVQTVKVSLDDPAGFQIAAFRLRHRDYGMPFTDNSFYETKGSPPRTWEKRYRQLVLSPHRRAASVLIFLDADNVAGPPRYLRVKVERTGGLQASCLQLVPIRVGKA